MGTCVTELGIAAATQLALPDMFAAGALHAIGRPSFGQLLFANRARFGHHISHGLNSFAY